MLLSCTQKPEDTWNSFGFSTYIFPIVAGTWISICSLTVYSKDSYLRFTCDVLGSVQMLTCEHKKKFIVCLKPLYLRFTCDVLGPVQMFTCEHKKKLVLSCLKHPYLRFTCDVLGFCGTLEHLYLRFTCVGDDPGPVQMFICEQKESFVVPWNLFTWDLHVMILDLYRCLLVNRNNLIWFFKTFL